MAVHPWCISHRHAVAAEAHQQHGTAKAKEALFRGQLSVGLIGVFNLKLFLGEHYFLSAWPFSLGPLCSSLVGLPIGNTQTPLSPVVCFSQHGFHARSLTKAVYAVSGLISTSEAFGIIS